LLGTPRRRARLEAVGDDQGVGDGAAVGGRSVGYGWCVARRAEAEGLLAATEMGLLRREGEGEDAWEESGRGCGCAPAVKIGGG
jgi:hypothetical protein